MKEDKPDAWMPIYIGDWDGDTADLSCEEDGAYGRLVRHYWRKGPPADNDIALARIVRMDVRAWKKLRLVLAPFFQVGDGVWRHKRVEAELVRWSNKKAAAVAKAKDAAEKRWGKDGKKPPKNAKGNAPSNAPGMPQAMLEQCPSPSSTEVDAQEGQSTLCGRQAADERADGSSPPAAWIGPVDVWEAFEALMPREWCLSYIAPCGWQDVPERALIPSTRYAGAEIIRHGRKVLAAHNLTVLERAA